MFKLLLSMIGLWMLVGCSSLQVSSDYNPDYDFSKDKTYAIVSVDREGEDTLLKDRIKTALSNELERKGFKAVAKEKADLHFVFHMDVKDKTRIDTDYQMMGYRRYGYGGVMVSTTNTYEYKEGTLVIDALHPTDQKIRWRGIATDVLGEQKTPQERMAYIAEVMQAIFETFPPKP